MEKFAVELHTDATMEVSQLLAVRIRNFGGVLRELAPGAALDRNDLRMVFFRTCSRLAYLSTSCAAWWGRGGRWTESIWWTG